MLCAAPHSRYAVVPVVPAEEWMNMLDVATVVSETRRDCGCRQVRGLPNELVESDVEGTGEFLACERSDLKRECPVSIPQEGGDD